MLCLFTVTLQLITMVGGVGFEPTHPEGNGFTVRRSSPTLPPAINMSLCLTSTLVLPTERSLYIRNQTRDLDTSFVSYTYWWGLPESYLNSPITYFIRRERDYITWSFSLISFIDWNIFGLLMFINLFFILGKELLNSASTPQFHFMDKGNCQWTNLYPLSGMKPLRLFI